MSEMTEKNANVQSCEVGDILLFGNYRQHDGDIKKTPIEWLVLDRKENQALLISDKVLDCLQYNKHQENWRNCDLRRWLNSTFMSEAFTEAEQKCIRTTAVPEDTYPIDDLLCQMFDPSAEDLYDAYPEELPFLRQSSGAEDKLFVLSLDEAWRYFLDDEDREASPTLYLQEKTYDSWRDFPEDLFEEVEQVDEDGNWHETQPLPFAEERYYEELIHRCTQMDDICGPFWLGPRDDWNYGWWLRSMQNYEEEYCLPYVSNGGDTDILDGCIFDYRENCGVRPAMWVNLSELEQYARLLQPEELSAEQSMKVLPEKREALKAHIAEAEKKGEELLARWEELKNEWYAVKVREEGNA